MGRPAGCRRRRCVSPGGRPRHAHLHNRATAGSGHWRRTAGCARVHSTTSLHTKKKRTRIKDNAAQTASRELVRAYQPCQPTTDDGSEWVFRERVVVGLRLGVLRSLLQAAATSSLSPLPAASSSCTSACYVVTIAGSWSRARSALRRHRSAAGQSTGPSVKEVRRIRNFTW